MHGENLKLIPAVVNKHNTARVASCWFIMYYSFRSNHSRKKFFGLI